MPAATKPAPTVATYCTAIVAALRTAAALQDSGLDAELLCEACGLTCAHDDPDEVENFSMAQAMLEADGVIAFARGDWHLV